MGVSLVEVGVSGSDCLCCRAMRGKKGRGPRRIAVATQRIGCRSPTYDEFVT